MSERIILRIWVQRIEGDKTFDIIEEREWRKKQTIFFELFFNLFEWFNFFNSIIILKMTKDEEKINTEQKLYLHPYLLQCPAVFFNQKSSHTIIFIK